MKGGSYDDVPNPKNTVVTTPGEGTMTEEAWMDSEDSKMIRNGYAGVGGSLSGGSLRGGRRKKLKRTMRRTKKSRAMRRRIRTLKHLLHRRR
jgi:hypothetical protein